MSSFDEQIAELGFDLIQTNRDGSRRYARRSSPYLQWWVVAYPDGTADLTWELELGAYLKSKGFHVSVQDELSLLLFPSSDPRGPADASWIAVQVLDGEARLGSVDFVRGT